MNPIRNAETCKKYQERVKAMMLHQEYLENEFSLDWIRENEWIVVPVERAQHFILEEIVAIVAALIHAGYSECLAIATEPLGPYPACYHLSLSVEDFHSFNCECGLFRYLLTDQSRTWAISCSELYNLFAGPSKLVEAMLGRSIQDAWLEFQNFIDQPSVDPDGLLRRSASRYLLPAE
jgi:hypothetical protein